MKKTTILFLWLSISGTALTMAGDNAQGNGAFQSFWLKFKAAVVSRNREAVATLSRFPLRMSYGVRAITTSAELRRRYREVFNEQTNAAHCSAQQEPAQNA